VSSNLSTSTTEKPVTDRLFVFQGFLLEGSKALICGTLAEPGFFYTLVHCNHRDFTHRNGNREHIENVLFHFAW
jgi:hypothetical protein